MEKRIEMELSQMEVNKADSEAHLCGAVKSLELRDFMNHEHLTAKFGRNVNFIVGVNGSGKSAILTGLTLVLGGQVKQLAPPTFRNPPRNFSCRAPSPRVLPRSP
jgi:AAA15 family ATPase/GTPase